MPRVYTLPVAILIALAWVACGGGASPGGDVVPIPTFPTTTITFSSSDGHQVELLVEIADSPEERARGLLSRVRLPEDHGMLFQFESATKNGFWMKDTTIPLSIAFISEDGVIVDILDMQPLSTTLRSPSGPYLIAVEANQGWFSRHGVEVGSLVETR